jgi:hypothetical protein
VLGAAGETEIKQENIQYWFRITGLVGSCIVRNSKMARKHDVSETGMVSETKCILITLEFHTVENPQNQ